MSDSTTSAVILYSNDTINWIRANLFGVVVPAGNSIAYGNNVFLFAGYDGNDYMASIDGTNWNNNKGKILPTGSGSTSYSKIVYLDNGSFIILSKNPETFSFRSSAVI
jgi:hypothetical protein